MTLADVEAILGRPARDETQGRARHFTGSRLFSDEADGEPQWISPEYAVSLQFTDGRVTRKETSLAVIPGRGFFDKVRRWLRL
jgi:hypothetical protein